MVLIFVFRGGSQTKDDISHQHVSTVITVILSNPDFEELVCFVLTLYLFGKCNLYLFKSPRV